MRELRHCPFCGDTGPGMASSACTFTQPGLFMAQVHCGHCGATGTRHCGEETLALAELKAALDWNGANRGAPSALARISETNKTGFTFALMALAVSYGMFDGIHASAILGYLTGSLLLGLTLGLLAAMRERRARMDLARDLAAAAADRRRPFEPAE